MEIRIEQIEVQSVASIRIETTQSEIGDKIGKLLREIVPLVEAHMNGAPLAVYHTWKDDRGEMEVAVPVEPAAPATIGGDDRIQRHDLPGGRAVVVTHIGPYNTLEESWTAINAYVKEHGLERRAAPWEQYISDCSVTPSEELITHIVLPIND